MSPIDCMCTCGDHTIFFFWFMSCLLYYYYYYSSSFGPNVQGLFGGCAQPKEVMRALVPCMVNGRNKRKKKWLIQSIDRSIRFVYACEFVGHYVQIKPISSKPLFSPCNLLVTHSTFRLANVYVIFGLPIALS